MCSLPSLSSMKHGLYGLPRSVSSLFSVSWTMCHTLVSRCIPAHILRRPLPHLNGMLHFHDAFLLSGEHLSVQDPYRGRRPCGSVWGGLGRAWGPRSCLHPRVRKCSLYHAKQLISDEKTSKWASSVEGVGHLTGLSNFPLSLLQLGRAFRLTPPLCSLGPRVRFSGCPNSCEGKPRSPPSPAEHQPAFICPKFLVFIQIAPEALKAIVPLSESSLLSSGSTAKHFLL